jgi:hypothetical protein
MARGMIDPTDRFVTEELGKPHEKPAESEDSWNAAFWPEAAAHVFMVLVEPEP